MLRYVTTRPDSLALVTWLIVGTGGSANRLHFPGVLHWDMGECERSARVTWLATHQLTSFQVSQGLSGNYRDILTTYWQQTINSLENETHDYKLHQLPLARIKKVMKADPDVKMISAEAPILFAKGCDIFITELTMRAWIHAEENKRRTLQRSDIASALAKSDMFDFLIDIVPREEAASHAKRSGGQGGAGGSGASAAQASSGGQIIPPQNNVQQQPPPGHPQQGSQQMGHADYSSLGNTQMAQEQEYRPQPAIYAPQVPPDPTNAYGHQPQQMFEGLYSYSLPTQPVSQ